jgi:hypothetical protein
MSNSLESQDVSLSSRNVICRTVEVWIPVKLPGRNKAELEARSHWAKGAKLKKIHSTLCYNFIREKIPKGWRPIDRYDVHFGWVCENRRQDPDNVISAMKYVFDGMVTAGLVAGDGWNNVREITNRLEIGKVSGVRVMVWEIE